MIERLWENQRYFRLFVVVYFFALALLVTTTPLSPSEAKIFYSKVDTPANLIAHLFNSFIPNVLGVRIFSYLFGIINIYLYYEIVRDYFKRDDDVRLALFIFMLTPGVLVSNIILNEAIVPMSMTLLFLIAYRRNLLYLQILSLSTIFWSDTATFSLYLSILIFGYIKRDKRLLYFGVIFTLLSLFLGEYSFVGKPKGHLPELLGVYLGLFSPPLFIYYFYALYRNALEGEKEIYWFISSIPLIISILLSIRQKILIVDFAPYLLAGSMIPIKLYLNTLRIRLKQFQKPYIFISRVVVFSMIFGALILLFHKPLYRILGTPERFFASDLYKPYDMAQRLREQNINCFDPTVRKRYKTVLKFYGFEECISVYP